MDTVLIIIFFSKFITLFENKAGPDQLASNEASWSGSTLFFHPHYDFVCMDAFCFFQQFISHTGTYSGLNQYYADD